MGYGPAWCITTTLSKLSNVVLNRHAILEPKTNWTSGSKNKNVINDKKAYSSCPSSYVTKKIEKKKSTLNTAACVPSEGSDAFAINLKSMMVLMEVWGSIYDVSWYNYTTAFVATISNNCRGAVRRRPISEKSHLDHNLVIITERYFFSDNKVFVARIWRDRDECTARENYLNHIEYRGTPRECLERVYTNKLQVSTW